MLLRSAISRGPLHSPAAQTISIVMPLLNRGLRLKDVRWLPKIWQLPSAEPKLEPLWVPGPRSSLWWWKSCELFIKNSKKCTLVFHFRNNHFQHFCILHMFWTMLFISIYIVLFRTTYSEALKVLQKCILRYLHNIPSCNHAIIYWTVCHKFLFFVPCLWFPHLLYICKEQKASLSPVFIFSFCYKP